MSQTSAEIPAARTPPLSNSERQRRWRERLKAKASGAAVTEHARDVVARAIMALWDYHERPGPAGTRWAEIDGCQTIEDYVFDLASEERGLVCAARAFLPGYEGLTPEEARAIAALNALTDVIDMRETREEFAIARLLNPPPAPAPVQPPLTARRAQEPADPRETKLTLVAAPPPAPDQPEAVELRTPTPASTGVQIVRLSVAQRARRRARLQKWK
ncbi:MAG: hypothetical protein NVSMB69_09700 [Novosphingobium sp.]